MWTFTGAEPGTFLAGRPPGGAIAAAALSLGGGDRKTRVMHQTAATCQHQVAEAFTHVCTEHTRQHFLNHISLALLLYLLCYQRGQSSQQDSQLAEASCQRAGGQMT